jgi:apolipoprotein N-acyltransferase
LASGLLLTYAWPVSPLTFLIFIAWMPMLWVCRIPLRRGPYFFCIYAGLLVWNLGTTWWVCEASVPGGLSAIFANAFLMTFPWIGSRLVRNKWGHGMGDISLVLFWMTFEYIHLNWELSWPWLTLGNAFAQRTSWIQWFAYTGVAGGSLWILLVNGILFRFLQQTGKDRKSALRLLLTAVLVVLLPLLCSYLMLRQPLPDAQPLSGNIVIVQPNVDPYQKFFPGMEESEMQKLMQLSRSQIDSQTRLVIWPETAIPESINEDSMRQAAFMVPVWAFLRSYSGINLLTGVEGYRFLTEGSKTEYSDRVPGTNKYVDGYNSAVLLDSNRFQAYHKSKLVPGVETLPSFLHFLDYWFAKFGGTTGSYARQSERTVLRAYNSPLAIAPAVCYESIYGEFMSKYVSGGANLIVVITNDGWWGETPGFRQHENYARLRAVETRRWVARSANTGISCIIDPYGRVISPQGWDTASAIKGQITLGGEMTFYVQHGDWLYRIASVFASLLILYSLFRLIRKKIRRG